MTASDPLSPPSSSPKASPPVRSPAAPSAPAANLTPTQRAWLVVVLAAHVSASLLLVFPYPPMTDFPHHEALVSLLRHFGDAEFMPAGMYVKNLGHPNQLFHLLAWPLSYVFGVALASKVVAALGVASVPLGGALLARHRGASPVVAAALVPVALGWLFTWGFVANLWGLGLLLALLPLADRFAEAPTPRRLAAMGGAVALMYFAHELMLVVFLLAVAVFGLARAPSLQGLAVRGLPGAFGAAVALLQLRLQEHLKMPTLRMLPNTWTPAIDHMGSLPSYLVGIAERFDPAAIVARPMRTVVFGLFAATFVVAAAFTWHTARTARAEDVALASSSHPESVWRAHLVAKRFVLVSALSFALFLFAPLIWNGASLVFPRFLAPAAAVLLVELARSAGARAEWPLTLVAAAAAAAGIAGVLPAFADAERNDGAFRELLTLVPARQSVASIDLDRTAGGRAFTVASSLSRVLAERGGRVLYSFVESTVAPVILAPEQQWGATSARIMLDNTKFRPAFDLTRFQLLFVHSTSDQDLRLAVAAIGGDAQIIGAAGEWVLLRSTHEVVPIDAPEAPLPTPAPETLRKRMKDLVARATAVPSGRNP